MSNDLLIKINADAKNAQKEFDKIKDKTSELESSLNKMALIAGASFAALTAEVIISERAFAEANRYSVQLSNALQNQGIYTDDLKKKYREYAEAIQASTGVAADDITKAQALIQAKIGQTEITQDLTKAVVDLAAAQGGDLNSAAEKVAKTIGSSMNAFAREGLQMSATATQAEKLSKVIGFINNQYGGLSDELNKADGYQKALSTAFGNFQQELGARFFPILSKIRQALVSVFELFSKYPVLADLGSAAIEVGVALTGIVAAIGVAVPAFLAFSAAASALGISLGVALGGIPLAIGVIIAAVAALSNNWGDSMSYIKASLSAVGTFIVELFAGIGSVLIGAFKLDPTKIKEGLSQIKNVIKTSNDNFRKVFEETTKSFEEENQKQNEDKKKQAEKQAAIERERQANLVALNKAQSDLIKLQNENASKELIDIKAKEIEVLKALIGDLSNEEIRINKEKLARLKAQEDQAIVEYQARGALLNDIQRQTDQQNADQNIQISSKLKDDQIAQLRESILTQQDIDRNYQMEQIQDKINTNNTFLAEQKRYGDTYAQISKALNSKEVQGVKSASSELVQLQQSKNAQLKEIGKVAAVAQITVDTAQSAMSIYKGFASIPIIGPALGIAGAAAAVAFGAERIGEVTAAADGGLIEGGITGKDSVPALLMPGELVVPKRNFNDVVGNIQNKDNNNTEMLNVLSEINSKFSQPQTTVIQGDVHNDDSYIDSLVRKISDAIEFRNAKIAGVNI